LRTGFRRVDWRRLTGAVGAGGSEGRTQSFDQLFEEGQVRHPYRDRLAASRHNVGDYRPASQDQGEATGEEARRQGARFWR
jgi:hypothetical protein